MRDIARIAASGVIRFYRVVNGERQLIKTSSNTILPNAQALIALVMGGDATASLERIRLYDGVALLYAAPVTDKDTSTPNVLVIEALCSGGSFTGDIDNAKLGPIDSGTLGHFSEAVIDPVVTKAAEQLLVTWTITFELAD
jgi:hypothetical protein